MTDALPPRRETRIAAAFALMSLAFAGLAGVWMRLSVVGFNLPDGVVWENMRHAHSHVMFFSWVTPALMLALSEAIRERGGRMRHLEKIVITAVFLGLLSFVPFMLSGYGPSFIAGKRIPLSVIFSTVSMFTWYAFAALYVRARRHLHDVQRATADIAVAALVLSTVGAWTRGYFVATHETDRFLTDGSVHAFVTTFSLGWLLVGAVALLHARAKQAFDKRIKVANIMMATGLTGTWILSVAQPFVPPVLWSFGAMTSWVFGLGLLIHAGLLWRHTSNVVAIPLVLVSIAQALAGLPGVMRYVDHANLRIGYLHLMFLLVVSSVLIELIATWAARHEPRRARHASAWVTGFRGASTLLLLGLLPTTALMPYALRTSIDPWAVALTGALPALVVVTFIAVAPGFLGKHTPRGGQ